MFQQLLANKHHRLRVSQLSFVTLSGRLRLSQTKQRKKIKQDDLFDIITAIFPGPKLSHFYPVPPVPC